MNRRAFTGALAKLRSYDSRTRRFLTLATRLAALFAIASMIGVAQTSSPNSLTVTLTGQSMIRSDIRETAPAAVPAIRGLLKGDVVFTNFEGAVAEKGETTPRKRGFSCSTRSTGRAHNVRLQLIGLVRQPCFRPESDGDSQHAPGSRPLEDCSRRDWKQLGRASAPSYLHTPKGTIALVASASGLIAPGGNATADRPGVNELRIEAGGKENEATADLPEGPGNTPGQEDSQRILLNIRDARQHADLVIVYQHNHVFANHAFSTIFTEGMQERLAPNDWLRRWTHAEVDAGADIVVMHGAPLLHGVEIYHGRPIFYDLGNFIYNLPPWLSYIHEPMNWESAVAYLQYQGKNLQSISFRPIVLNYTGQGSPEMHDEYVNNQFIQTRGLPTPAAGARAGYILQRLADASKPFGTKLEIKGDTAEIKLKK